MPLKIKISEVYNTTVLVWHVVENLAFFMNALQLTNDEQEALEKYSPKRRMEWLSARYLIKLIRKEFKLTDFQKDKYGKPFLQGSDSFISISHSHDYATIIMSDKVVGVDIQKKHNNIERISHKFISKAELEYTKNESKILHMHINWGAKESMYKGYGKKELSFINHMSLDPYLLVPGTTIFTGTVTKNEIIEHYNLYTQTINDYVLVYAIQN